MHGELLDAERIVDVFLHYEIIDPAESLMCIEICAFYETLYITAQSFCYILRVKSSQQLIVEINLHVEVMQTKITEVPLKE